MLFFPHSFHSSLLLPYDVLAKSLVSCQVFSKKMVQFYYLFDRSLIILWSLPCLLNSWFCSKSLLELFVHICK